MSLSQIFDGSTDGDDDFVLIKEFDGLFLPYQRWMEYTHLTIGIRSPQLKNLDEAIKRAESISFEIQYLDDEVERYAQRGYPVAKAVEIKQSLEREAYWIVQKAFDAWAKSEGDWRESRRNQNGAAIMIFLRLLDYRRAHSDIIADSKDIIDAADKFVGELFRGAKVQARGADLESVVNTGSQIKDVAQTLNTLGGSFKQGFETLFRHHFGAGIQQVRQDPFWAKELSKFIPNLTHELVKLIPAIGAGVSAGTAVWNYMKALDAESARYRVIDVSRQLPSGDAREALSAIRLWQSVDIAARRTAAAQGASAAAAQLAAIAAPVIGAPIQVLTQTANAVVTLLSVLADVGMQYRESKALERYLRAADKIDHNIFAISPLVGAYYVLNVPLSAFSLHLIPFESPTFFADTEYLRESGEMKTIIMEAERLLDGSKFELVSAQGLKFRTREDMLLRISASIKAKRAATNLAAMIRKKGDKGGE